MGDQIERHLDQGRGAFRVCKCDGVQEGANEGKQAREMPHDSREGFCGVRPTMTMMGPPGRTGGKYFNQQVSPPQVEQQEPLPGVPGARSYMTLPSFLLLKEIPLQN